MPSERAASSALFMRGIKASTRIVAVLHQWKFHGSTTTTATLAESTSSVLTITWLVFGSRFCRVRWSVRGWAFTRSAVVSDKTSQRSCVT